MASNQSVGKRPVIVGEVLFDVFDDGARVLGGAPFNVAWHLQGLGCAPVMVTRIGEDELGAAIVEEMRGWGMTLEGVQRDPELPTGQVVVSVEDGQPSFEIAPDQAYDQLEPPAAPLVGAAGLLYHGSLICRSERARRTLEGIRRQLDAPVFVDVNLRQPWWRHEVVMELLQGVAYIKLNADELCTLTATPATAAEPELVGAATRLREECGAAVVIVTRGADGAVALWGEELVRVRPQRDVVTGDTVGAGDAFSAACIAGVLKNLSARDTLAGALELASAVCTIQGAVSHDRELYRRLTSRWGG